MKFGTSGILAALAFAASIWAQGGGRGPQVVSPVVGEDRRVTFRLLAPQAENVSLNRGDFPGTTPGFPMNKGENGIWEVAVGPLEPGAYRYTFNVNGIATVDPRNPINSESNNNVWSMVYVPGSESFDTRNVPHGAVASVTYWSSALNKFRRMHVYTPPGYENGKDRYPVFFLLHGAGDTDHGWTSVGRAGFIFDNLIAAKKAKPMIVVMPAGHTSQAMGGGRGAGAPAPGPDEFTRDFVTDIMPYAESHYRVLPGRTNRAIAGLSMGGSQTLNIAIPHLDKFSYVGVYSSGLIGAFARAGRAGEAAPPPPQGNAWEEQHKAELDNAANKKGLKLLWFATGKEDFLLDTTKGTVELLKKHGFSPVFKETAGGHTWSNWRDYLVEFTPQLFQ